MELRRIAAHADLGVCGIVVDLNAAGYGDALESVLSTYDALTNPVLNFEGVLALKAGGVDALLAGRYHIRAELAGH